MRHHPIRVGAPRDIVPPPSHDAATPPALLQRSDDDFVESTIEDLRTTAGRASLRTKLAAARNTAHVLKLFQPLQRQFHLAVIEAWCDTAGTPRIDPARVDSAGLVLRRIRGTGSAQFLEAWVKSNGRLRGWVRVAQHTEQAPPLATHRLARRPVSPSIDLALTRFALEREDALLDEHVVPLFMAPPDVCVEAKKTLFYGLVPTASAEIADVPVDPAQALGTDFGPGSAAFTAHLVDPLRGQPMTFVLGGETVHPDWFEAVEMPGAGKPTALSLSHWNTLIRRAGATGMKRFILLLRQLASEFDAFGDTAEGRAVFAELETIRLPLMLRGLETVPRTVTAGSFLRAASRVLLERDPAAARPEMPVSWPALDAAARTRLANVLSRAVTKRFADIKQTARTLRRAGCPIRHPRVRPPAAGGRLSRSYRMERLQRAVRHRTVVRRQRRAAGADRAPRRHRPQPAALAQAERRLRAAAGAAEPAPRESEGSARGQALGRRLVHGWLDLQLQPADHHDLRLHLPEHLPVALRPDLPVDVLHQDLHSLPEAERELMAETLRPLIGWPLLPVPDDHGQLPFPNLETSVRESIRVILSTRPGEQLMRPDFGAGLDRLLHEPNTLATRRSIRDLVQDSLTRWERRILLDRVEVWEVSNEPSHVSVEIAYRLARTGAAATMHLTVQLEG